MKDQVTESLIRVAAQKLENLHTLVLLGDIGTREFINIIDGVELGLKQAKDHAALKWEDD